MGVAWGSRLLGEPSVTWVAFGDGGAQKGEVHEAMNFASIHRLPVIFCVENNRYTQSVPTRLESSTPDLVSRAAGYGMPGEAVDGMEVEAVHAAAVRAIERARAGDTRGADYRCDNKRDNGLTGHDRLPCAEALCCPLTGATAVASQTSTRTALIKIKPASCDGIPASRRLDFAQALDARTQREFPTLLWRALPASS